ncbi:MAG: gluconate 2-dehydrogenase subunit 3 family protein, partial [Gemmatimonadaceae bacterium]|nr:gluconate 2-dehydrogenase subunit 3 family protein [Gemmatimonadaceae bacterium]
MDASRPRRGIGRPGRDDRRAHPSGPDTPGARDVGVDRFIDTVLADHYSAKERATFLAGLADVDRRARETNGSTFLRVSPAEQHNLHNTGGAPNIKAYHALRPIPSAQLQAALGSRKTGGIDQVRL